MSGQIPHLRIVVTFCVAAIVGYSLLCGWVVIYSGDAALRGDVIGTWKSFAVGVFAFWVGSSSGGKVKDLAPQQVEVTNPPGRPVPVDAAPAEDAAALAQRLKDENNAG